jgi:release factor glutamine methyltransferase
VTGAYEQPSDGTERTPLPPVLARAVQRLAAAGVASPRVDAEVLAAHVLGVGRGRLMLVDAIRFDEVRRLDTLVARRATRIPLQHLLGTAAFRHLELAVGPGAFVPRPETELLAGWGIDAAATAGGRPVVVDLCSGTGAIALAVAHELPSARVTAVERSAAALGWLRRNAAERAAAGDPPIDVLPGDVTDPDVLSSLAGTVDVVLCNPPYVPDGTPVPDEVGAHDPAEAVFGGADGLAVIGPVVALAAALLRPGGVVGIEHDDGQARAVPDLLRADGRFVDVVDHDDLAGRPRFATARRR